MENKNKLLLLILSLLIFSCTEFEGEKIELNYKEGYAKILSDDYVIDSLIVDNHISKYYIIGLPDKSKGNNIIYFRKKNLDYTVYSDSLDYYCSKTSEVNLPGIEIVIRKRGFLKKHDKTGSANIEYFGFNQIPCGSTLIDTIKARNPYVVIIVFRRIT